MRRTGSSLKKHSPAHRHSKCSTTLYRLCRVWNFLFLLYLRGASTVQVNSCSRLLDVGLTSHFFRSPYSRDLFLRWWCFLFPPPPSSSLPSKLFSFHQKLKYGLVCVPGKVLTSQTKSITMCRERMSTKSVRVCVRVCIESTWTFLKVLLFTWLITVWCNIQPK